MVEWINVNKCKGVKNAKKLKAKVGHGWEGSKEQTAQEIVCRDKYAFEMRVKSLQMSYTLQ